MTESSTLGRLMEPSPLRFYLAAIFYLFSFYRYQQNAAADSECCYFPLVTPRCLCNGVLPFPVIVRGQLRGGVGEGKGRGLGRD